MDSSRVRAWHEKISIARKNGNCYTHASFCFGSKRPSSRILASMNNLLALSTANEINAILNIVHFISSYCHTFVVLNFPFRILHWAMGVILEKRRCLLLEVQKLQPVPGERLAQGVILKLLVRSFCSSNECPQKQDQWKIDHTLICVILVTICSKKLFKN